MSTKKPGGHNQTEYCYTMSIHHSTFVVCVAGGVAASCSLLYIISCCDLPYYDPLIVLFVYEDQIHQQ